MGFFATALNWTLAAGVVIGGVVGVILVSLFGIFLKVLPFLIKLAAVALLAYFGLNIFGII